MTTSSPFPYEGPPELREAVGAALSRVIDPEVALSIVDVGLVYGVTITPQRIHVRITMTSAACPVADVVVDDIHAELGCTMPEGREIEVELAWEPAWTPERLSERARRFLQW
ncbi:metal-sulfur cluster assembly factor [Caldimonas sp. KR1-144]|uniref:metal-sulfur cluster assembly factor n=1 Tax=Caldimonas sp. KR1-144 TaxID=3400911 RepID=UPI003C0127E9